ncbi:MAG: hypothetical protein JXA37_01860 [Chloroflexia bacterium]|nr:hypothetical protein [Chloroflexia bacterium]
MPKAEASLKALEAKLLSYENFKRVLQQYLQRLLSSDQDTLAVVAEMLDAVKALSSARSVSESPTDLDQVLELRESALRRYGGIAHIEGAPAPPLLGGGVVKLDDPQVYGLSLICTWLDCIVSNPEQSLESLRKVFLKARDSWGTQLNRRFNIDLGRLQPVTNPTLWLADLLGAEKPPLLYLARIYTNAQALGLEPIQDVGTIPLAAWRHLLQSKPVYDLTARYARAGHLTDQARLVALKREKGSEMPCLYRVGLTPAPAMKPLPDPIPLEQLFHRLGGPPGAFVQVELIEQAAHLSGNVPPILAAHLPLNYIEQAFGLMLNHPPAILMQDVTPPGVSATQCLLRVCSSLAPRSVAQVFRLHTLAQHRWPERQSWSRVYRFQDLGQIGVQSAPPGSFLQVSVPNNHGGEDKAEVYFQDWGQDRFKLSISAASLRRAAQTGSLILLGVDVQAALQVLADLQGLIGPAAQQISPVVSQLDCQVRWRAHMGTDLFKKD